MAVLSLPQRDRMVMYSCIDLLPDLECDVYSFEVNYTVIEESFISGLDDWWPSFIADMTL